MAKTTKFVSDVLEDGGKFYVKIIYTDGYTDTYVFKTEKVAKAFRQQMLKLYEKNQRIR